MNIATTWKIQKQHVPISDTLILTGFLNVPEHAQGVILFAHGSGSGRHSPRNQFVAQELHRAGFVTMLIDLLTEQEEEYDRYTGHLRFDIALLSERVAAVTEWLLHEQRTAQLPVGYFGASTGAAAALIAAVKYASKVQAVVSRGGRPDMAGSELAKVQAPTLLIVGSLDTLVISLNEEAYARLSGEKRLEIVPGATHLFEEPGKLELVAQLARGWFESYLSRT